MLSKQLLVSLSDGHTLLTGVNQFLPALSTFLVREIQYNAATNNAVDRLSYCEGHAAVYGHKYTHSFA